MLSLVDYAEKRGEKAVRNAERNAEKRGKRIGEKRGQKIAESRMQELLQKLIADNRTEDLVKISKDKEHLKKCTKNMGLEKTSNVFWFLQKAGVLPAFLIQVIII